MAASANLENTTVKMLQFALPSNGEYIEDCIDLYTDFLYPKMYWQINIILAKTAFEYVITWKTATWRSIKGQRKLCILVNILC